MADKLIYTQDELEAAQSENILHYLQSKGYEFKEAGHEYRSKLHSSLIINEDGRWYWNSKDISGRKPVELLKQLLIHDDGYSEKEAFITAIKELAEASGRVIDSDDSANSTKPKRPQEAKTTDNQIQAKGDIVLPPANKDNKRIIGYLCGHRKIDNEIVNDLIERNKLYETAKYHNACFVCHDENGIPKHAYMRGTISEAKHSFKSDVKNSDKSYGIAYGGNNNASRVFCFENHIDALSHATLYKLLGHDYRDAHRITLHGTSFKALERFLEDNPQVDEIVSCLDNDETGKRRTEKMCKEFSEKGYKTFMQLPHCNDYNEQLIDYVNEKENDFEMEQ